MNNKNARKSHSNNYWKERLILASLLVHLIDQLVSLVKSLLSLR